MNNIKQAKNISIEHLIKVGDTVFMNKKYDFSDKVDYFSFIKNKYILELTTSFKNLNKLI